MTTFVREVNMRISISYLIPLIVLLLLIVALQPARAQDAGPPCMASPVTLFESDRKDYSGEFNSAHEKLKTEAKEYKQESDQTAAAYKKDAATYQGDANATASKYKSAGETYQAATKATDGEYKTAAAEHQGEMAAKRKEYLSKDCPRADTGTKTQ